MSTSVEQALTLLLSGMLTVFMVLGLVVLMGRILISVVNKSVVQKTDPRSLPVELPPPSIVEPSIVAVIAAAVDISTGGHGQAKKITKTEP